MNKIVKLTINTSKGTLQQRDSQVIDFGISHNYQHDQRGQILMGKANSILDDIRIYEYKQKQSQVIELQSNFQRVVEDVQSENGFQFFNEISQDSQYNDMGCPAETSILDEFLGRRESHPETRILQKQYPLVQKKPQFQMPVLFSPESTGSNSATPPVMQQTTAKKQLDFETTQMQLNIQKLENVFDMTQYQHNIKDYLLSASDHNILSMTDEMPPITTSDEKLGMKQSEWLKYAYNMPNESQRQQEILGMHYIHHYEDQEDEHIIIDLEKEQNDSYTLQAASSQVNRIQLASQEEDNQSRQVLGEKPTQINQQVAKKEQPLKEYLNALSNPLITKSSKIASVSSIDYENNQNQLVRTDSNILSQFKEIEKTKRMPNQLFQRLDQKKIMSSQPASVKNAQNNTKARLLYHTQENIRKRGSQNSAMQIIGSSESSFIGAPGCGNTTQSQGNQSKKETTQKNLKRVVVSSTGNNSRERLSNYNHPGVTSHPSNQKTGRKNNRVDYRTVTSTATKANEPQVAQQERVSSFSIGHTPHNNARMPYNLQQKQQQCWDQNKIHSQTDVLSQDFNSKHQRNPNTESETFLTQIHQLRLKNAEQRAALAKISQRTKFLETANEQLTCDNKRLNRLRESDLQLFKVQESTIQRLHSEQGSYAQVISSQQREIEGMRGMIQRTIEVKMEYEGVIKELLDDQRVRDLVIEICLKKRQEKEVQEIEFGEGNQDYAMSPHEINTVHECSSEMNY